MTKASPVLFIRHSSFVIFNLSKTVAPLLLMGDTEITGSFLLLFEVGGAV